jgi:hypothetical protein
VLGFVAALLAGAMLVVYIAVMQSQGDRPLLWVVAMLVCGAVLAVYGALVSSDRGRAPLLAAAVLLLPLGFLAIFSIGFPILIAGALALIAALRKP